MEVTASAKSIRVSTRKVRLVADSIRNMSAKKALQTLSLVEKRGASVLTKVLKSAIANAVNNAKLMEDNLIIHRLEVNEGAFLKRFHASTRGRIHPYKKRSSHIRIVLKEK
jgi:large subunit ribosomal protein L22